MRAGTVGALVLVGICAFSLASEQPASRPRVTTRAVASGRAPAGELGYWYMRAVTIERWKGQLLAVPTPRAISFLRVRDSLLEQVDYIPLRDTTFAFAISPGNAMHGRTAFWTSGDIDSDASDEILIALDTLLLIYRRVNPIFVPETVALPRAVRQLVVGDIDNDGRNELIACCDTTTDGRWPKHRPGMKYHVYVCRYTGKRLEVLWDDHAKLGYGEPIMPDYFWSVADYRNTGRNQLLITRAQSDVSPTVYNLLEWDDKIKGLSRRESFIVSDTLVPASYTASHISPYALGRMQPFRTDMGTLALVEFHDWGTTDSGDLDVAFRQRLIRMAGGGVRSFGDVWLRDGPPGSNCYYATIDPDGAGTGLLRVLDIWHPRPGKCFYEFRRVVASQPRPSKEK
jgi:hypothetical protein